MEEKSAAMVIGALKEAAADDMVSSNQTVQGWMICDEQRKIEKMAS